MSSSIKIYPIQKFLPPKWDRKNRRLLAKIGMISCRTPREVSPNFLSKNAKVLDQLWHREKIGILTRNCEGQRALDSLLIPREIRRQFESPAHFFRDFIMSSVPTDLKAALGRLSFRGRHLTPEEKIRFRKFPSSHHLLFDLYRLLSIKLELSQFLNLYSWNDEIFPEMGEVDPFYGSLYLGISSLLEASYVMIGRIFSPPGKASVLPPPSQKEIGRLKNSVSRCLNFHMRNLFQASAIFQNSHLSAWELINRLAERGLLTRDGKKSSLSRLPLKKMKILTQEPRLIPLMEGLLELMHGKNMLGNILGRKSGGRFVFPETQGIGLFHESKMQVESLKQTLWNILEDQEIPQDLETINRDLWHFLGWEEQAIR